MKQKLQFSDVVALIALLASGLATALVYAELPDAFPIHFGADGRVNGTFDKPIGPWFMPIFSVGYWLVHRYSSLILRGEWRERLDKSPVATSAAASALLLAGCHGVCLYMGLHPAASPTLALFIGLGLYCVGYGQLMPRLRRNPFIGCRNSFTSSSDENWARTHRFAGFTLTAAGLAAALLAPVSAYAAVAAVALGFTAPHAYSLVLARKLAPQTPPG